MTKSQKIVTKEKDLPYKMLQTYHKFIYEVTNAIETYKFNIAISKMMIYLNHCYKQKNIYKKYQINFLLFYLVLYLFLLNTNIKK